MKGDIMHYTAICDFDGTLTGKTGRLEESTILKIKDFTKNNKLCIASYNENSKLEEILKEYSISCDYYSFSSAIGYINNTYWYFPLSLTKINSLLKQMSSYIYTAYASFFNQVYIINYQSRLELFYPKGNRNIVDTIDTSITSITLAINKEGLSTFYALAKENELQYQTIASDKNRDILVISSMPTKKEIISYIKKAYPNHMTIGIGDSSIDYEFIKHCDIKIAMLNAEENLKKLCDKTTDLPNTEDGCMTELIQLYNS